MDKSPHQIAEERMEMAHKYSVLSEELAILLDKASEFWREKRDDFKSDTACTKAWHSTESGRRETIVRLTLKSLEKQMSAHRTMLEVMSGEARNQY